jgi:holliday junction DNA helicase RuvA
MIGKIRGVITEIDEGQVYIETASGVTYKLYATPSILSHQNKEVSVYTYLDVKEDSLTLFAFETKAEYKMYKKLIAIDGVGPKLAYTVCSYTVPEEIILAVTNNNIEFFKKIRGIGLKTAQRIVLELSSSIGKDVNIGSMIYSKDDMTTVDALVSLGFKREESMNTLKSINASLSIEEKIREAIKLLTKKD